jgi:hypothetical protein
VRKLIALLLLQLLAGAVPAVAQQTPPYVYGPTLGTASVQILPVNPLRKRLMFVNPNATSKVAVCPLGPSRNNDVIVTAVINGAGCVTILPYSSFTVDGSTASGPTFYMPVAWVGIASAGASALTIYEFE